jgi:hypothetical protein
MSKRSRRTEDSIRPSDEQAPKVDSANETRPADHGHAERQLMVSGAEFQKFDAWLDAQLDELVSRWAHAAAPAAALIRRVVPEASRHQQT